MPIDPIWNLTNLPPKGNKDVADFAFSLFEEARLDKERLNKPQDFLANYALYRGKSSTGPQNNRGQTHTPVNLYFANVERTIANITARQPVGEVTDLNGKQDGAEDIFTAMLKKWWKDTNQQTLTRASARTMEIYGGTFESPSWDKDDSQPLIEVVDPFGFFPAPGYYTDMSKELPYCCFVSLGNVDKTEQQFNVSGIAEDEAYDLLGTEREMYKTDNYETSQQRIGNYSDSMTRINRSDRTNSDKKMSRCLIMEVWVRDYSTRTIEDKQSPVDDAGEPIINEMGVPVIETVSRKEKVYRDGVRKITIVRSDGKSKNKGDFIVLDDSGNPNINPSIPTEMARNTHPWGRFPVYGSNSYRDLISIWGFAAAEQVGDLLSRINFILSKLFAYVANVMTPPLIVQKHCGITKEMIENQISKAGRLILMPTTPSARIEFMQIPNLPATFFQVLDLILKMFDRVYQIEDADRGVQPTGITAASALVALQERNDKLMKTKSASIDNLVENRSRWTIGLWQNFGWDATIVEVAGESVEVIPADFAGRKFSYVVESGSTMPRTSLQIQELSGALYAEGTIDQQARLEAVNFPDWKAILLRMQAPAYQQLLQYLVEMGMPVQMVAQIEQFIVENQQKLSSGGSANPEGKGQPNQTGTQTVRPGTPRSQQGGMPPAGVQMGGV